jgi:hypothetical protein
MKGKLWGVELIHQIIVLNETNTITKSYMKYMK